MLLKKSDKIIKINKTHIIFLFTITLSVFLFGCSEDSTSPNTSTSTGTSLTDITVTSTDFTEGGTIPAKMYGNHPQLTPQNGSQNQSPQLTLTDGNTEVKSHLILMYDITSPYFHWFRANVTSDSIANSTGSSHADVNGITSHDVNDVNLVTFQTETFYTNRQYFGPQPPEGTDTHTYVTMVFGIDTVSLTLGGSTFTDFEPLYNSLLAIYNASLKEETDITYNGATFRVLSYGAISGTAEYLP